jgi:hypothetical protein
MLDSMLVAVFLADMTIDYCLLVVRWHAQM